LQNAHRLLHESRSGEILLGFVLQQSRTYLYTYPEKIITPSQNKLFEALLSDRAKGTPIAYLLGEKEFYSLNFKVTPDTLIPRPETELLVDTALELLSAGEAKILELGTGSGAIAVSLAKQRANLKIIATDFSPAALEVAKENVAHYGLNTIDLMLSDWFSNIPPQTFDLIISNPPYIADTDPHLQQGDLRFEPLSALQSGVDGLDDIRQIIMQAGTYLAPGGRVLLEHGYDQAEKLQSLFKQAHFHQIKTLRDLAGIPRVTWARK
ncbi:MAG TPA: peptide chain release factor N(5)-glutamine methyltransferase, partial [Gammaproteobacteria bacterium]|nr:peptide chain release factor N(5)-glutamine methyltransferase [Gammaproteobacteria bacterium]